MTKIGFKRGGLKNFGMAKDRAKRASTDRKLTDVASTANQGAVVVRGGGKGKVPQKRGKDVNPEDEMAFVEERFTCLECLETSKRRGGVHDPCASNGSNRCRRHSHGADIENVSPSGEDREHLDAVEAFKQALNHSSLLSPCSPATAVAESPPTTGFYADMMEEMEKLDEDDSELVALQEQLRSAVESMKAFDSPSPEKARAKRREAGEAGGRPPARDRGSGGGLVAPPTTPAAKRRLSALPGGGGGEGEEASPLSEQEDGARMAASWRRLAAEERGMTEERSRFDAEKVAGAEAEREKDGRYQASEKDKEEET
ncbi:hypothetical protein T484DRAFT_1805217 [Baffinella frigidus]|nr:hypothetical protein T484DRAFT_1805217 [Cryptophyta sp. CCMP2293]